MIGRVSAHYAIRSLLRRPARTALSAVGMGFGCAVGLILVSYYAGVLEIQIRSIAESGSGHLRIVPEGWPDTRENSLRLVDWEQTLAKVQAAPGIRCVAPRARANGLAAFGNRTVGVEVMGVDPVLEQGINRIVSKSTIEGRYLQPGDKDSVVVGKTIAERLDVELEDDLLVTLSGRGEMKGAMLRIVGILSTGSRELDLTVCHVMLDDLAEITDYPSAAEIAMLIDDYRRIDAMQAVLAEMMPPGNVAITWEVVNPAWAAGIKGDIVFLRLISFIIVVVVALGIASAQITAYLERRRELGILTALGMRGRQVVGLILLEAVLTGLAGAVLALLMGGPVAYYVATEGINVAAIMGDDITIENVMLEPYVYGDFGVWIVWYALAVSLAATITAALYPAWFALKTNPATAMRTV